MHVVRWALFLPLAILTLAAAALAGSPVPSQGDVEAATKVVAEVYKKEFDAAKSPTDKQALALTLLGDADDTKDDASAYAIYKSAQKLALGNGDVDGLMRIGERIAARYEVDATAEQRKLFESLAEAPKTPLAESNLTRYLDLALPPLVEEHEFDQVAALVNLATAAAKKSKNDELQKYWQWKEQRLTAQANAWTQADAALAKLKVEPADAEASGVAGQYRAFWEEDWKSALPLLTVAGQKPWQELAQREQKKAETLAKRLALADAWYDAGVKETASPAKEAVLRHAGGLYEHLLSELTAFPKRRVEARLSEIRDVASALPKDVWVEVLDLVNLQLHTIDGEWQREGLSIVCHDPKQCKHFYVPVLAEGAYDLRIRAARTSPGDALLVSLSRSVNGCAFGLNCYNGKVSGLEQIDRKGISTNESRVPFAELTDGQPYELVLQVEPKNDEATITAIVNNRLHMRWTGPRNRLNVGKQEHRERIALQACYSTVAIYSVQIKRKSGAAWMTE